MISMKNILLFLSFNILIGFTLKAQTTILNDVNNNVGLLPAAKVGTVTIPANGYYRITVKGAAGGSRITNSVFILGTIVQGGKGGAFSSEFYFNQGAVLEYCLGAAGESNNNIDNGGGGGGGGTGIRIQSTGGVLAIAGGGGGANFDASFPYSNARGYASPGDGNGGGPNVPWQNRSFGSAGGGLNGQGQHANWSGANNGSPLAVGLSLFPGVQAYGGGAGFNATGGYVFIGGGGALYATGLYGGGGYGGGGASSFRSYLPGDTNPSGGAGGGGGYSGGTAGSNSIPSQGGTSYNTGSNASAFVANHVGGGAITIEQLPAPSLAITNVSCTGLSDGVVQFVIPAGYNDRAKPFSYTITTANGTSVPQLNPVFNNVPEGAVFVVATDGNNQLITTLSGTVGITPFTPPTLQITSNGTINPSICPNTSASLSATCTEGTVKWYDAAGTVLQGTGSPFSTPNLTENTTYKVRCESATCESSFADVTVQQITARLYVNKNAVGANNGSSWANAFTDLQSALNFSCPIITEIWVAKGTYTPAGANGDRNLSFILRDNLKLYGGFAGTETILSDRNYSLLHTTNLTTLSGDLNGDDGSDFANNSENSNNVVKMEFISNTARLDGFTISGGNNNLGATAGGGIYSLVSNATIANCNITGNSANNRGGGVCNYYGDLTFENCSFVKNRSLQFGGAIFNASYLGTTPTLNLLNCTFINNTTPGGTGIILYNDVGGSSSGINVNFIHCSVTGHTGNYGIRNFAESSANTITIAAKNSIFHNNWGNLTFDPAAPVNATNCLFDGPTANYVGSNNLTTFTSPFISSTDLRLVCGSAAVDSGTSVGIPSTDKDGNARPFPGTGVDIGAYELQGGNASVPTAISVSSKEICLPSNVTLSANCAVGFPTWYAQATGGTALGTGASFVHSPNTNTTYYVACANPCATSNRLSTSEVVVVNSAATLDLTSDFNTNATQIANTTLTATNKINNPAKVVYKAGNSVTLNQGFEATSGSTFLAQIGGCENVAISGLVAYYPFNGNAIDATGNGFNGTINGATLTVDKFGATQKALNFDGNDFVRIPNLYNAVSLPLVDVTYSLWFKPNQNYGAADFYSLIIRTTDGGFTDMIGKPSFGSAENDKFQFFMFDNNLNFTKATTNNFVANQWYHVVATRANGTTKIYLNAIKEGEATYANSPYFYPDLYLGGHATSNRWYYNGAMDDLRIYNRALSDSEVQAIYNAERP
jgi:hypothetical protein